MSDRWSGLTSVWPVISRLLSSGNVDETKKVSHKYNTSDLFRDKNALRRELFRSSYVQLDKLGSSDFI